MVSLQAGRCSQIPPCAPSPWWLEGTELPAQLAGRSRTAGRALGQACHGICVTFGGVNQYRGVPWQAPWPLHYMAAFHFVSLPISSVHCSAIQRISLLPTTCENSCEVLWELWLSPSILRVHLIKLPHTLCLSLADPFPSPCLPPSCLSALPSHVDADMLWLGPTLCLEGLSLAEGEGFSQSSHGKLAVRSHQVVVHAGDPNY